MNRHFQPHGGAAVIAVVIIVFGGVPSGAEELAVAATGPSPDQGVPIEGWMVYPSLFVGAVFNDNVYGTSYDRRAAAGLRVRPSFVADVDNGLHRTTTYFTADAQIYPGLGARSRLYPTAAASLTPTRSIAPTNATGRAGFSHIWTPLNDVTVYVIADYTRQNGMFGSNFGAGASGGVPYIPSGYTPTGAQQYSNQISWQIAAEKKFSEWFLRTSSGVQYVSYDSRPSAVSTFGASDAAQNSLSYMASLRGGLWLTPQIYGFVEPALDLRRYQYSTSNTNGYRIIGGFGSDLIGLFRGEVYGGYQSQSADSGSSVRGISAPTYGARLYYDPTPYLKISATVTQTLAAAAAPTPFTSVLNQTSTGSRVTQALLQGDYAFSPYWTAFLRGGYGETRWSNSLRVDTSWAAGFGVGYNFWRNISLTLDYQFQKTSSNGASLFNFSGASNPAFSGYAQSVISAGITYRY